MRMFPATLAQSQKIRLIYTKIACIIVILVIERSFVRHIKRIGR